MAATGTRIIAGAILLMLAGCASLWRSDEPQQPGPRERLTEAAAMLERGDFRGAYPELSWVYSRCPGARPGRDALLLMAASELDPRNDARRLDVGTALAAEYLALPAAPGEGKPLAQSLYLLGLELGAERPASVPVAAVDTVLAEGCPPTTTPATPSAASRALTPAAAADTPGVRVVDASWLPELPGATVPQRLGAVRAQRDSVSAQMAALMEQVTQLQQRVASQQQEIERIRRTLRP
ncbi:MAG TPA: hypothetical protein VMK65_09670 [Longimicrobiales bacterium]|nr:hypothetical protein [Longimicrobiales bacterium]